MQYRFWCVGAVLLMALASPVRAQVTIPQEYDKLIKKNGEIAAFGAEGFGDKVDLNSGSLQIVQVDVDLPGNNALPVRVARRFATGDRFASGHFGAWNLDIPYAHGVFANHVNNPKGWTVGAALAADVYKRCSQYGAPPTLWFQGGEFQPDEYWQGNFLHMPGAGDEEMLVPGSSAHVPTDGNTYSVVTKGGAAMRCVALASTSEAGSQGEGFEVVMPDGTVYTLNQMVSRLNEVISKPVDQFALRAGSGKNGIIVTPQAATTFTLARNEVLMYPTKATERFGNTVTYTWSATNPWQLLQITASDGRQLTLTYMSSTSKMVSTVTDGSRTWTYTNPPEGDTVTLPDGSKWISNLSSLFNLKINTIGSGCDTAGDYSGPPPVLTGTVQAPTGALATFTMQPVLMGRSWVGRSCVYYQSQPIYALEPIGYFTLAVLGKKITGPGLPAAGLSWSYDYGSPNMCWASACTVSSPTTRTTTLTDPDGAVNRYSFSNRFQANEGQLVKTESGWDGTTALRTVDTTLADATAAPYGSYNGESPRSRGDTMSSSYKSPQRKVVTTQQGRIFTWEVATGCVGMPYCFDAYARPTKVVKTTSTP